MKNIPRQQHYQYLSAWNSKSLFIGLLFAFCVDYISNEILSAVLAVLCQATLAEYSSDTLHLPTTTIMNRDNVLRDDNDDADDADDDTHADDAHNHHYES